MEIENTIEELLCQSVEDFFYNPELPKLKAKLEELYQQSFRFGFITTLGGDIEREHIKEVSLPHRWFTNTSHNVAQIIEEEKKAAIRLQDFEFAARMREFETYLQDNILDLTNPNLLLKIIKTRMEYCVLCKGRTIYLYINTAHRRFKLALINLVNSLPVTIKLHPADHVVEKSFKLSENENLASLLYLTDVDKQTFSNDGWAYIAYTSNKPSVCLYSYLSNSAGAFSPSVTFSKHLSGIPLHNLELLTVLITQFPYLKKPLTKFTGESNPLLDTLLAESVGWLVYCYQLENLFRMATGTNLDEAVNFRRNVNKKNITAYSQYLNLPLLESTLGQVMNERMLTEFVLNPSYSVAYKVYNYFN